MSADLIARLRAVDVYDSHDCWLNAPLFAEAAERVTALEKALEPFSKIADDLHNYDTDDLDQARVPVGLLFRARAALSPTPGDEKP